MLNRIPWAGVHRILGDCRRSEACHPQSCYIRKTMATTDAMAPDPAFALASTIVAMGGLIMMAFQLCFFGIGLSFPSLLQGGVFSVSLIRLEGVSGVVGTLAAMLLARPLLRAARRSVWIASIQLIIGATGMYLFVPRTFVYANF